MLIFQLILLSIALDWRVVHSFQPTLPILATAHRKWTTQCDDACSKMFAGGYDEPPLGFDAQRIAELEAMGGDPFFLSAEDDEDNSGFADKDAEGVRTADDVMVNLSAQDQILFMSAAAESASRFATDGLGPSSSRRRLDDPENRRKEDAADEPFEWDGVVDEDAHLDMDF